jgi:hypothetical protein
MNFDKTYVSVLVVVILAIVKLFKIPVLEEQLTPLLVQAITAICGIIALFDTVKVRGVDYLGRKK